MKFKVDRTLLTSCHHARITFVSLHPRMGFIIAAPLCNVTYGGHSGIVHSPPARGACDCGNAAQSHECASNSYEEICRFVTGGHVNGCVWRSHQHANSAEHEMWLSCTILSNAHLKIAARSQLTNFACSDRIPICRVWQV